MKVKINELQRLTISLLNKLKNEKGNEIEIKSDFYWDIDSDQLYNPHMEPKNLTIGQLVDDLGEIGRLSVSEDDAIPYDLKRIAEIIKAISIENPIAF